MEDNRILFDERHIKIKIDTEEVIVTSVTFDIKNEINNHSSLKLNGIIYDETLEESLFGTEENKISVELTKDEDASRIIFSGYVYNARLWKDSDGTHIEIEGVSNSYKLDEEKRFLSYQDISVTYQQIIDQMLENYEDINIVGDNLGNFTQDRLLVQYNETDWEFLDRLAAMQGIPVLNVGLGIKVGFSDNGRTSDLDLYNCKYWLERSMVEAYTKHRVETGQVFILGESINIEKEEGVVETFVVAEAKYSYSNMYILGDYTLVNSTVYTRDSYENRNIAGKAIEGTVVEVLEEGEVAAVTVNFNQDLTKTSAGMDVEAQLGEELFQFPYVTPYSQTHTGYFCTPEIDDNVIVYFPGEDEESAFIIGSVNNAGSMRFNDKFTRNFIIPAEDDGGDPQYEMNLSNGEMSVVGATLNSEWEDNTSVINNDHIIEVGNNHSVKVETDFMVESSSNIQLKASSNYEVEGTTAVKIKGGQVSAEGDSQVSLKSGAALNIGAANISMGS